MKVFRIVSLVHLFVLSGCGQINHDDSPNKNENSEIITDNSVPDDKSEVEPEYITDESQNYFVDQIFNTDYVKELHEELDTTLKNISYTLFTEDHKNYTVKIGIDFENLFSVLRTFTYNVEDSIIIYQDFINDRDIMVK